MCAIAPAPADDLAEGRLSAAALLAAMRSALTAVIPLPLITRLVVVAGAPPATGAVGLGAAGGGAATIAKIIAVIGIAAATTVGATIASTDTTTRR